LEVSSSEVKDENGDLFDYFHIILNTWKNYFCQLLNVWSTEVHTSDPVVSEPSPFEVEIAVKHLKGINCLVLIRLWQS
jgi:hypothetical protein